METFLTSLYQFAAETTRKIVFALSGGDPSNPFVLLFAEDDIAVLAFLLTCSLLLLVALAIVLAVEERRALEAMKKTVESKGFQSAQEFMSNWIRKGLGGRRYGYKYMNNSGCYVILTFDHPVENGDFSHPSEVYVGQSVHVYERVRTHFAGKGNGDVYADLRYGRFVYVSFWLCEPHQLNDLEKQLIRAYNATSSYNKTRGGSDYRGW